MAFRVRFGDVKAVCVNVKPGFDHCEDPMLDVKIIYDGEFKQLNAVGILRAQSEIADKVWWNNEEDSLGWPYVHFIAKSDIGWRDLAAV